MDQNVILVATFKGRTWVIEEADYNLDWETQAFAHISKSESKYTYDRSVALLLAHNIQRKNPRENGVWEVFLKEPKDNTENTDDNSSKSASKKQDKKKTTKGR